MFHHVARRPVVPSVRVSVVDRIVRDLYAGRDRRLMAGAVLTARKNPPTLQSERLFLPFIRATFFLRPWSFRFLFGRRIIFLTLFIRSSLHWLFSRSVLCNSKFCLSATSPVTFTLAVWYDYDRQCGACSEGSYKALTRIYGRFAFCPAIGSEG